MKLNIVTIALTLAAASSSVLAAPTIIHGHTPSTNTQIGERGLFGSLIGLVPGGNLIKMGLKGVKALSHLRRDVDFSLGVDARGYDADFD